ncbi:LysE family translocator [Planobispora siamensis]|uniref:Lysine transporter LysE n=1 Tax=Planobispora siamensis TaxID=936338 RepID=A0A8J3SNY9_9ACTN|nr:LysE family translocator [Planobispora siamensis]GIH97901.1 lysine transporter LysE [Planobispora siamensis]
MFLIAFIGSCFLLAMIPGASTAVILRQTLRAGRGPGMAATLGNETGILLWALAAAFGLSALVLASEVAYDIMRIVGAVFLVVMGAQSIWQARAGREAERPQEEPVAETPRGWRRSYLLGLSTCLANPKAAVFAMSFLPQFVPEGANVPLTLVALAVIWVLVDTVWYGLFIWMVGRAKTVFGRPAVRRRLERISGVVLIGLGVRLAVEAR